MPYTNDLADTLTLDGAWDFSLGQGGAPSTIRVPGAWEAQGFSKHIDGPARYRRAFGIPGAMRGGRILLEFDAVCHACEVRLNGAPVGGHAGM
jgi:beta-galactosidase/beta-glucuronidase